MTKQNACVKRPFLYYAAASRAGSAMQLHRRYKRDQHAISVCVPVSPRRSSRRQSTYLKAQRRYIRLGVGMPGQKSHVLNARSKVEIDAFAASLCSATMRFGSFAGPRPFIDSCTASELSRCHAWRPARRSSASCSFLRRGKKQNQKPVSTAPLQRHGGAG
jgi:hypothetical protein